MDTVTKRKRRIKISLKTKVSKQSSNSVISLRKHET